MTEKPIRRRDSDPRAAALHSLVRWERGGRYINMELESSLEKSRMQPKDRALYAALLYGVCERIITLDGELERICGRDRSTLDTETLSAIRLGIYQIAYMDKIPPHAAVNETVECAPARSRSLVNAALRRFIREGGKIRLPDINKVGRSRYLSAAHSLPLWLTDMWLRDYPDDAEALCESANRRPPTTIRVNTLKISTDELLTRIGEEHPGAALNALCPDMIDLPHGAAAASVYGYDEGLWFVQDASARLCAAACGIKCGETAVDTCAAPGGKSFSLAVDMENSGRIISLDIHKNKLKLVSEGARRLSLDIIETRVHDGKTPLPELIGAADCVICDAPCSGLGVLAKKPDIRYKSEDDVSRLPEVQYAILSAAAEYVRDGGRLVYSTCTLRRAENEDIREKFLSEHACFAPLPFRAGSLHAPSGELTLMPHKNGADGFYITEFIKNG